MGDAFGYRRKLLTTTQQAFKEYEITETLGIVRGNTVRTKHIGMDILAGLKTLFGGEIEEYSRMLAESREQAFDRMMSKAISMGANAIVGVRFTTSSVMAGAAEILCYGTAVKVRAAG